MSSVMDFIKNYQKDVKARSGNRIKTVKPKDGRSRWRLLPSWRGANDPQFFHEYGAHFIRGDDGQIKAVYVCVSKTFKRDCPLCELISQAISGAPNDSVIQKFKEMNASGRVLFNALEISDDGKMSSDPVIFELPFGCMDDLLEIITEYGQDNPDVNRLTDPKLGTYITIKREGTGKNTTYTITPGSKEVPVKDEVLKKLHNLDDWVSQEYDEGRMKAIAAVRGAAGMLPAPDRAPARIPAPSNAFDDDIPDSVTAYPPRNEKVVSDDSVIATDELDDLLKELN
jgi:hypothetical protein